MYVCIQGYIVQRFGIGAEEEEEEGVTGDEATDRKNMSSTRTL